MHQSQFVDEPAPKVDRRARLGRWAAPLFLVAVTVWTFHRMLAHHLQSDDFSLVSANRDLGVGGFLRFLLAADYGDRLWVYWRPAWVMTFWVMHSLFGAEPGPYQALALVMHIGCVLTVYFVARRIAASMSLSVAGALLFAIHPAHAEAVVWVAAATNVLPAAACLLIAAWCAFEFANGGSVARLPLALGLAAISLLWKEAAYGFPLVLFAAWLGVRAPGLWSARRRWLAAAFVAFVGLIVLHYVLRNKIAGTAGSLSDMLRLVAAGVTGFVWQVVTIPGDATVIAASVVLVAAVLFVILKPSARFWLAATIAGSVPYVFLSSAGRFAYFVHAPLCILLVVLLDQCAALRRSWWRTGLAVALLLSPLLFAPSSTREVIARYGREAERADRVLTALVQDGLANADKLFVDIIPGCLVNGMSAALLMRTGRPTAVESLQFVNRPPFMIHIDLSGEAISHDRVVLKFDDAADRYVPLRFGDRLGGLLPVPVMALCNRYHQVADAAAAQVLLASGTVDPSREPLLYEAPHLVLDATATGTVSGFRLDVRNMGLTVECTGAMLLVVAFPIPVDFVQAPAAILIDGEPAPVLIANLLFHAVVVPAGKHDVRLMPIPR